MRPHARWSGNFGGEKGAGAGRGAAADRRAVHHHRPPHAVGQLPSTSHGLTPRTHQPCTAWRSGRSVGHAAQQRVIEPTLIAIPGFRNQPVRGAGSARSGCQLSTAGAGCGPGSHRIRPTARGARRSTRGLSQHGEFRPHANVLNTGDMALRQNTDMGGTPDSTGSGAGPTCRVQAPGHHNGGRQQRRASSQRGRGPPMVSFW